MKTSSFFVIVLTATILSLGAAFGTATYYSDSLTGRSQPVDALAHLRAESLRELRRTDPSEWLIRRNMAFDRLDKLEAVDPIAHARATNSPVYAQWQEVEEASPFAGLAKDVPTIVGYRISDDEILINVWIPPLAPYDDYRVLFGGFGYHFALFPSGLGFQRGSVISVTKKFSLPLERITSLRLKTGPADVLEEVQVLGWNITYARCPMLAPRGNAQWVRVSSGK